MACTRGDVACQLDRIVDALNGWSWPTFVSTLIATLVGAGIALLGAWLLARRDRQERYSVRLDEALARLLPLVTTYLAELKTRESLLQRPSIAMQIGGPPSTAEIEAALEVVQLIARGKRDENLAGWVWTAFHTAAVDRKESEIELELVREIPLAIRKWRQGESEAATVRRILELNGAR